MRREPLLLAVAPSGLLACIGHGDGITLLAAFTCGEEAAFASWLARRPPDEPCRMLVDLPDESYQIEDLPRVRGSDRRALFARRLAHWFPEPRFARATPLGALPDGRQGAERVLFAGMESSTDLLPWLDRLAADGRRPQILVPASALLPRLPLPGARQRRHGKAPPRPRLLATHGRAGLRISLLAGEHTLFSRLVRGHADSLADPQALATELERTRDYLAAQHRIASDAPLDRIVADLPAQTGTEHATLPPIGVAAADTLAGCGLPNSYDAHLLLALRHAPTTIGWPLAAGARRWPRLPERRVLGALALVASTILGALVWMEHQAQVEAAALAATERARAARAAALAAEEAELAAREAERAALAALDAAPPPLPTPAPAPAEPAPAACPPASSPPPGPIARRIDGVLRRPDGEILLWVEGTWQSARALGLHPIAGDAAVVVAAGRRTQLRSGELVPTAVATVTAGPGQAYPERDDAAPADRAAGPADSAARPGVDMRGARP